MRTSAGREPSSARAAPSKNLGELMVAASPYCVWDDPMRSGLDERRAFEVVAGGCAVGGLVRRSLGSHGRGPLGRVNLVGLAVLALARLAQRVQRRCKLVDIALVVAQVRERPAHLFVRLHEQRVRFLTVQRGARSLGIAGLALAHGTQERIG